MKANIFNLRSSIGRSLLQGPSSSGWVVRATGARANLVRMARELCADFLVRTRDEWLDLAIPPLKRTYTRSAAEWIALELMNVIVAAADLCFGEEVLIRVVSVEPDDGSWLPDQWTQISKPNRQLPLSEVTFVAFERKHMRNALLARLVGTASGFFDCYEEILQEIFDAKVLFINDDKMGTKEWIIAQGWAVEKEIDAFLATIVHYEGQRFTTDPDLLISPNEARLFLRRLLGSMISWIIWNNPGGLHRKGNSGRVMR
jgi:hypothetical protein